jgi:signal transduction histidine kinase
MRVRSVRGHVLAWLFAAGSVGALLLCGAAYTELRDEQNETLDANLREVALAAAQGTTGVPPARPAAVVDAADRIVIARWTAAGDRIYLSDATVPLQRPPRSGLARQQLGGDGWDAFAVVDAQGTTVAAQLAHAQEARAAESATRLLVPFIAVLGLVAVLLLIALRRGLAPLDAATAALAARSESALEPLDESRLPIELRPLVHAMNHLMARVAQSMQAQQRFVADAAHELRTPVAALQLQQQLVDAAPDAAARERALIELHAGIERIRRLTVQLLDLSRIDAAVEARAALRPVALDTLAASVVADLALIADRRGIDLGLQQADRVSVRGDEAALRILIANLVDNALRYTPSGGVVDVSVVDGAEGPELNVSDSGPGIAPAERERVFVRFYRGAAAHAAAAAETSAWPGSGLGLAIVQAIAERHAARVTLHDSAAGGLHVRVAFAREAAAAVTEWVTERAAPATSASGGPGVPA